MYKQKKTNEKREREQQIKNEERDRNKKKEKDDSLKEEAKIYKNRDKTESDLQLYGFKQRINNLLNLENNTDPIPELFSRFNKFYRADLNNYILDKIKEKTISKRIKDLDEKFVNGSDLNENRKLFSKIRKFLALNYHPDRNKDSEAIMQRINEDFDRRMSGGKKRKSRRKNAPI